MTSLQVFNYLISKSIILYFFVKENRTYIDKINLTLFYIDEGKTICTGSDDATLRIWNPNTGETIHVVNGKL